jgi:hypothetical protein
MPRLTIDYSKTVIYKIVCNDPNIKDLYVGSTTDFTRRKCQHKLRCNTYNTKLYQAIRNNCGWENWDMIEIEKFPCNDGNEAHARERQIYEQLNASLNIRKPYITDVEYVECKKQQQKQLYTCQCGSIVTIGNKAQHCRSKKHIKFMEQNI